MWFDFFNRCNYLATLEGIAANTMFIKYIYSLESISNEMKDVIYYIDLALEWTINAIDDVLGFF